MGEKKQSKPGRIVMLEGVPDFRGCTSLRKGTVQRLDEEATKELLASGKAEAYESKEKRDVAEKRAEDRKAAAVAAKKNKTAPPKKD